MSHFNYEAIENIIGYEFNNKKLLRQAFFRSSYANENGRESNEVLEFVGDKVLDLATIRILLNKYSKNREGGYFKSSKQEGELTSIKSEIVCSTFLAEALERLELDQFIFYGKNDLNNKIRKIVSIKEDVFEAIIGAIAIDSSYNFDIIIPIVEKMLLAEKHIQEIEASSNYVGILQEETSRLGLNDPVYILSENQFNETKGWDAIVSIDDAKIKALGHGPTQKGARKDAAMKALRKLEQQRVEREKKILDEMDIFDRVNIMVQSMQINKPDYVFEEDFDEDGNPVWKCLASSIGLSGVFVGISSNKQDAKREALTKMIKKFDEDEELACYSAIGKSLWR